MSIDRALDDLAAHVRYAGVCANLDQLQTLAAAPGPAHEEVRQAARDLPRLERAHALTVAAYVLADQAWSADIPAAEAALTRLTGMAEEALRTAAPEVRAARLRAFSSQPHRLPAGVAADALAGAVLILAAHDAAGSDYLGCWSAHG